MKYCNSFSNCIVSYFIELWDDAAIRNRLISNECTAFLSDRIQGKMSAFMFREGKIISSGIWKTIYNESDRLLG